MGKSLGGLHAGYGGDFCATVLDAPNDIIQALEVTTEPSIIPNHDIAGVTQLFEVSEQMLKCGLLRESGGLALVDVLSNYSEPVALSDVFTGCPLGNDRVACAVARMANS
jgi:hypothetical protein